ncbi:MAG: CotH kinase family protein [Verrucomicrobia bacterium]|nr:CotH kinase family protein [Verrucomicrobiota bacterium]
MTVSLQSWVNGLCWLPLLFALRLAAPTANAAAATDVTGRFYDPGVVQNVHLEIKQEDLDRMHRALPQRIYVPGNFRWNDQVLTNVGVRFKGGSSSMPDSPFKRGYLIDFSEFQKGQRLPGLRQVALDNGIQFGSLFSERLITDVLHGVGVKASRCNYARLYLNGKFLGVYVNVERINKNFLQRHFGNDQGGFFKVDESGPGAGLEYLGDNPVLYRKTFELEGGPERRAYAGLVEFIRALNQPAVGEEWLRKQLDVEAFIKTTAVMLFAGAFDQYTGWQPHNYYLYRNPADQRWTYIPWDLDVGFADRAFGRVPVLEGWNAAWPVPVPGRPLMEHLIANAELLRAYREQANQILETWFKPEILIPKLRALYEQIRADLAEDPFPPRRATVPSDSGYEDILASMEDFIRKRYRSARSQLDAPGNRPRPEPMQPMPHQAGPQPGPPSEDAPTDLHAVKVMASSVELRWTNHDRGAVAYVVQRCTGTNAENFVNAIGQSGPDITTAVDRNVQPGNIYRYRVYAVLPTPKGPRGTGVSNVITVQIPEK